MDEYGVEEQIDYESGAHISVRNPMNVSQMEKGKSSNK